MTLQRIDVADDGLFAEWFDVFHRSELARSEGAGQGWQPSELRALATEEGSKQFRHLLTYRTEGAVVASAYVEVTVDDNLHFARTNLHVDPLLRRRGHGSAALAELERYVRDLGRTQIVIDAMEGPHEVGTAPNRTFAPLHGYELSEEGARRDIAIPRPAGELDELDTRWRTKAEGYEILDWNAPTPVRWLAERAHLCAVMPVEADFGAVDIEEGVWDEDRVRHYEKTADDMGREMYVAVAREIATDTLVGFTELTCSRESPENAYQWDTLVLRAHRGHHLGGILKIATIRRLEASGLRVKRISTFNALANSPMIRVNEALGATVTGGRAEWHKFL